MQFAAKDSETAERVTEEINRVTQEVLEVERDAGNVMPPGPDLGQIVGMLEGMAKSLGIPLPEDLEQEDPGQHHNRKFF